MRCKLNGELNVGCEQVCKQPIDAEDMSQERFNMLVAKAIESHAKIINDLATNYVLLQKRVMKLNEAIQEIVNGGVSVREVRDDS